MDKQVWIESFADLYDATVRLEIELENLIAQGYTDGIKGEITLVDGKWRLGVIVDGGQLELPLDEVRWRS